MTEIRIKSFNGIGDLLFVTPTLRVIKEGYPDARVVVNTNCPELLEGNPYVDAVNDVRPKSTHRTDEEGVFLGYPDPIHRKNPTQHHIKTDWEVVTRHFRLKTRQPALDPELYCMNGGPPPKRDKIGVQVMHKGHWHQKKVWPHYEELSVTMGFEPIPKLPGKKELVEHIASCPVVICAEGGISHIAKAVGTPAVVIMGGFHRPEWAGYESHVNLVDREVWCRDECYNPGPCKNEQERLCMWRINMSAVWTLAEDLKEERWYRT